MIMQSSTKLLFILKARAILARKLIGSQHHYSLSANRNVENEKKANHST